MKVCLNLQTAAQILYHIAFSNLHLSSHKHSSKNIQLFSNIFIQCSRFCSLCCPLPYYIFLLDIKKKPSRNRPGVAQRVPGVLVSQIFMTFGTWRWWGYQPHAPAAFNPRKCSWYSFPPGAESAPGPWYGRKVYVNEKSGDITENRSRNRPTRSAAP